MGKVMKNVPPDLNIYFTVKRLSAAAGANDSTKPGEFLHPVLFHV
ncbi:MAG: hypothetical protein V3S46_06770 [Nitrospinota bacterium]